MLIGLCGGICAGKSSIADFLVTEHGFKRIRLARTAATPAVEKSASLAHVPNEEDNPLRRDTALDRRNGTVSLNTLKPTPSADEEQWHFPNVETLLDFVTKQWQTRWVTTDIWDETVLDTLQRRPFFLLVSVDAPISVRWERFKSRCATHALTPPDLSSFVLRNDAHLYAPRTGLAPLLHRAQLRLLNSTTSLHTLHASLRALDLPNESRLRPNWDQYFMQLASLAAHRSNCMKRRVGCVLVRERRVISTGYNGTPRGIRNCNEGGCARCNGGHGMGVGLSTCLCIHAEENALLEAGRERVGAGSVLYCDTCPCLTCSIKITQVGIEEVVYAQGYSMDVETAAVFREGGVRLRQFSPVREGLVDLSAGIEAGVEDMRLNGIQ